MLRKRQRQVGQTMLDWRELVVDAIADEERLHQRYREQRASVERWRDRARLALAKGLEPLAKEALARTRYYQSVADAYSLQYERQRDHVDTLKRGLQRLEAEEKGMHRPSPTRATAAVQTERRRQAVRLARAILELDADPVADRLEGMEGAVLIERQLAELKAQIAQKSEDRSELPIS